jgi:hypothetical protein
MDIDYANFYSRQKCILQSAALVVDSITRSTLSLPSQAFPLTVRYPYHTSILTGEGWILELLAGHSWQIWTELGVSHHVFQQLTTTLWSLELNDSHHVRLEEQLAIFLYADNLNTTQTLEYTKDRYNTKIRNERVSPKVPPTTYIDRRMKWRRCERVEEIMSIKHKADDF